MTVGELKILLNEFDESLNIGTGDDFYGQYTPIDSLVIDKKTEYSEDRKNIVTSYWVRIYF